MRELLEVAFIIAAGPLLAFVLAKMIDKFDSWSMRRYIERARRRMDQHAHDERTS